MMQLSLLVPILLLGLIFFEEHECSKKPNIIFIYADDLGMNDISLTGSPQTPTPNIDALGLNGLTLHNYYGEWVCTPSRGALLSGIYPIRLGFQHAVLGVGEPSGLPLNLTLLPQHLKTLGYKTHMIGKWNLGYQTKEFTPTYRGFDSFLGYYNGLIDYYDHTVIPNYLSPMVVPYLGLDLHNDTKILQGQQGKYATYLFTETAEKIIHQHNTSQPLFLYLAHLAVHAGNFDNPNKAPAEVISKFKYIKNLNRRIFTAKVSALDDGVGAVFRALYEKNMLENSIVIFVSDNGAEVNPNVGGYGSNYPLRGKKYTQWEGGIRLPAIIWSPLLNLKQPRIAQQLMHVTDWLPTLYTAAGGQVHDLGNIDGVDLWKELLHDSPSPRTEMLQNLDPVYGTSAYRLRNLKLVNGTTGSGYDFWYGPSGLEGFSGNSTFDWVFKNGSVVGDVLKEMGMWITNAPNDVYKNLEIKCQKPLPDNAYKSCQPDKSPCIFNITADPCEYVNLADKYPKIVKVIMNKIKMYKAESMKPQNKPYDPRSDPLCHHFMIVPWLDPEYYNECNYAEGSITS